MTQPTSVQSIKLPKMRNLGILHLPEVVRHTIERRDGATTHELEFTPQGRATVTFLSSGDLTEFTVEGIELIVTEEHDVFLRSTGLAESGHA